VTESYKERTVIVTGATSGIGLEAVYKFASLGASKVIIAARDTKKGESTKSSIAARLGYSDQLEVWELDMASFDSVSTVPVRTACETFTDFVHQRCRLLRSPSARKIWTISTSLYSTQVSTELNASSPSMDGKTICRSIPCRALSLEYFFCPS
jgi:hypothetical protein